MAMQVLQKGSDAVICLPLMDAKGTRVRVSDFHSFSIKLYTTDESVYAEYSFQGPDVYHGIVADDAGDWIVINAPDLEALHEGVLLYKYHMQAVNGHFEDFLFDKVVSGQLDIYLMDN
jgi:hypothetical protein